jgi:DNA (cytosine-5)-methyltransferase 1
MELIIKPVYKVPSMREIEAIPWNGFNVISTFSGGGGSCLGYRLAGYRVLWANEFIPAAQATYKANHPNSILDERDIRNIKARDILEAINLKIGEIDIFDGSPPCAAFSTAGSRESGWGKTKKYSDTNQRVDDLFFEYQRLLKDLQPKVFVAENVSGLVKGTAKGYFIEIIKTLKSAGYNVKCKVLNAQWLDVPQSRERAIFIGVRNDLNLDPVYPKPRRYYYSVRDAWSDALRVEPIEPETNFSKYAVSRFWDEIKIGETHDKRFNAGKMPIDRPAYTITQSFGEVNLANRWHPLEKRCLSVMEIKRLCAFPDDYILTGNYQQQVERMGRAVPPLMMKHIAHTIATEILCKI